MSDSKKDGTKAGAAPLFPNDALLHCKFGRFHIRLVLASLASINVITMVSTTPSFLLPNTECDLNMTIMQKGLLAAAPFFGVICGTLLGCCLIDAVGRRPLLVGGHSAMFISTILEASSQSYWILTLMKVLQGVILIVCFMSTLAVVGEFTYKKLRDRFVTLISSFMPLAHIGTAILSWALLTNQNWHFIIWKGYFELHAWNIYLYVCSVFSLIATLLCNTLPETPMYLFFQRKEGEALEILKDIYHENTGKDRDTFPMKALGSLSIRSRVKITMGKRLKIHWYVLKQLFQRPLVYQMLLFMCLSFVSYMVYATLRLWYPQLSTVVESYLEHHGNTDGFCTIMNHYTETLKFNMKNTTDGNVCVPVMITGAETYFDVIIISLFTFFSINVGGFLALHVAYKVLMFMLFVLCAVASAAVYWTWTSYQIALLIAVICSLMGASLGLQKIALYNVLPTIRLRLLGLSIFIMSCRAGALVGTILFPVMLQIDCMVPFLVFSIAILSCTPLIYFTQTPPKRIKTGDK